MNKFHQEPLVSFLTPVYNGAEHLEVVIKSVLAQTYDNWEYVIVNNCSNDDSLEIIEHYAQQDERIKIHNNNLFWELMPGLNHAFKQISDKSTYCKVVHADDWLFPECAQRMVEIGEAHPNAGIVGSYCLDGEEVTLDGLAYPSEITSGRKICRRFFFEGLYLFGYPSSLLIRSALIRKRDRVYDESHLHGDLSAYFDILEESDFGFVHQVLTFTRRHEGSQTSNSVINKFSTYRLGSFKALVNHGPDFLNEKEMEHLLARDLDEYYRFLARKFYELETADFWDYHSSELKSLGLPLKYPKLAGFIVIELLNPRMTLGRLKQALKDRFFKP